MLYPSTSAHSRTIPVPRFPHGPLGILAPGATGASSDTQALFTALAPCLLFESSKECTHSENFLTTSPLTEYSIGGTATRTTVGGLCRRLQSQKTYWAFTWVFDCPMPLSDLLWHLFPNSHLFPPPPSSKF